MKLIRKTTMRINGQSNLIQVHVYKSNDGFLMSSQYGMKAIRDASDLAICEALAS